MSATRVDAAATEIVWGEGAWVEGACAIQPGRSGREEGVRPRKIRGVIKTRRIAEVVREGVESRGKRTAGDAGALEAEDTGAHGSLEGAKDRARKMCAWILAEWGGAACLGSRDGDGGGGDGGAGAGAGGGGVLDVAGGAGYLALQLCKAGVPVTIVDPRSPRPFNRFLSPISLSLSLSLSPLSLSLHA